MKALLLLLISSLAPATCVQLTRRACLAAAVAAPPLVAAAAEPTGPPVACDEECQQARVARKAELLRQQTRTQKADVKVLFGADFQAGRRETKGAGEVSKVPVLGEFLLPGDGERRRAILRNSAAHFSDRLSIHYSGWHQLAAAVQRRGDNAEPIAERDSSSISFLPDARPALARQQHGEHDERCQHQNQIGLEDGGVR